MNDDTETTGNDPAAADERTKEEAGNAEGEDPFKPEKPLGAA